MVLVEAKSLTNGGDSLSSIYKLEDNELVSVGDLVALNQVTSEVHIATIKDRKKILGVCVDVMPDGEIVVCNEGIVNVNVVGEICLGDHISISDIPGKAKAIRYDVQEEQQFDVRSIGKVIGLTDVYSIARVLLNVK